MRCPLGYADVSATVAVVLGTGYAGWQIIHADLAVDVAYHTTLPTAGQGDVAVDGYVDAAAYVALPTLEEVVALCCEPVAVHRLCGTVVPDLHGMGTAYAVARLWLCLFGPEIVQLQPLSLASICVHIGFCLGAHFA